LNSKSFFSFRPVTFSTLDHCITVVLRLSDASVKSQTRVVPSLIPFDESIESDMSVMKQYCFHQSDSCAWQDLNFLFAITLIRYLFPADSRLEENPIGIIPEIGIATPVSGGRNAQVASATPSVVFIRRATLRTSRRPRVCVCVTFRDADARTFSRIRFDYSTS